MTITALTALVLLTEAAASATPTAAPQAPAPASATAEGGPSPRWILRHRPRAHEVELGLFTGVFAPAQDLLLRAEDGAVARYASAAAELGLRLGYTPSRFFGLEGELSLMPTNYNGQGALLYAARAQALIQAGWWRVVPFVALGGGAIGVRSDALTSAGDAAHAALHVGGGVKLNLTERLGLRVDVRDVVVGGADTTTGPSHSAEALLSLALRFGVAPKPPAAPPPPPDADADGIADADDWCSHEAGDDEHGCPPRDGDGDGFKDDVDACPSERGIAPDGCPPGDRDGDGVVDPDDACPDAAGPPPSGCADADGDGVELPDDRCPAAPETVNGYADGDGCPDELPAEVARLGGVIDGLRFDAQATLRRESRPALDQAARVLADYPELRVEISAHTDARGLPEVNRELSLRRAEAVKAALVERGVAGERLTTRGAGADEPIADRVDAAGRATNARIELKILH